MKLPSSSISRRSFLTKSLSAGLVLGSPSILNAAAKGASDKLHVAIIGFGKQGRVLFEAMSNIPGLHFQAVCDIWEYNRKGGIGKIRALQGHIPNGYTDAAEMLSREKGLDAVIVATPDFWHAPHTVMSLEAGLNVYCEKMMSNTIDGARSMVKAMESSGKLCQIGHQRRSNPRYRYTLEQLIQKHNITGQIVNVNGQWNRAVSSSQDIAYKESLAINPAVLARYGYKDMHQFMNWRTYRDLSGGPISDLGAHQIDIFNWFLGTSPKRVYASGGNDYFRQREHFDNVMTIFDYDTPQGGVRAFYQVLTTTSAGGGYYESFMGTEGTINISERAAYTKLYRESGSNTDWEPLVTRGYLKKVAAPAPAASGSSDAIASYESAAPEAFALPGQLNKPPHQPHLENFFAAVRGQETLTCDARHAFESEAPIYWVNPSALDNTPITLTEEHLSV
ncbi:MAG: Gfo/Idh/MocA family protein [Opitutales bacterium]|jgi:predicted dehydrogenase